ncbi:MAG: AmmeMemoRadiSam system protein B [Acidobacteriota bacterium]
MSRTWPALLSLAILAFPLVVRGQAGAEPAVTTPPSAAEVRAAMGIPSAGDVRGQQDTIGFASTPEQMARTWVLSATPPEPERLGPAPPGLVVGAVCPHDDYLYAGRAYRQVLPLVTARTVVLVGVFHTYRAFGAHDLVVFDGYRAWRAPDGEVAVSSLREEVLSRLPAADCTRDNAAHDREHSLEPLVYFLRHARADLEIVPIIVPASPITRLEELALHTGQALATVMRERGLRLGEDVAVVISSDAVHYGADFAFTPHGEGGVDAYLKACARDRELLTGPLAGALSLAKAREFSAACVAPEDPNVYRLTWCGRFSIPFGMLLLAETARALGLTPPVGHAISYSTSVGQPELALRDVGLGETAPANLYHFVGYPAAAFTLAR